MHAFVCFFRCSQTAFAGGGSPVDGARPALDPTRVHPGAGRSLDLTAMASKDPAQPFDEAHTQARAAVARAGLEVERLLCAARGVFFSMLLGQYALTGPIELARASSHAPLLAGIAFSAWVILRVRTARKQAALGIASVTVDATAAFGTLSENALWPAADYPGIVHLADTSVLLLATIAAGLRLSVPAAVWGGALNVSSLVGLVAIDRQVSRSRFDTDMDDLGVHLLLVVTATIFAAILAATARRLVYHDAAVALRAEQAERGLGSVLADVHDARSLLTSVRLNAEIITRADSEVGSVARSRLRAAGQNLVEDLEAVEHLVLDLNGRALRDLSALRTQSSVRVFPVAQRTVALLSARFARTDFDLVAPDPNLEALVAGGDAALQRVLLNLLCNACEGDGRRGAAHVRVTLDMDARDGDVVLEVADDGPGLPDRSSSRKAGGVGIGLRIVQGIVEASGGRFHIVTIGSVGAAARVRLPPAAGVTRRQVSESASERAESGARSSLDAAMRRLR